jgi:hypothetical protein
MIRFVLCLSVICFSTPLAAGLREASVKICNPTSGDVGSGVLVASDEDCFYGVTSGHAFGFDQSKIGKLFDVETKDHYGTAKLLALSSKTLDLAVFSVAKIPGLDIVPIATEPPKADRPFVLSGFPGGKFHQVEATLNDRDFIADDSTPLYAFELARKSDRMGAGASGGAVTQGGKLYTTISAADKVHTFAVAYTSFYRFTERDYQNCFGQRCRIVRLVQRGAPAMLTTAIAAPPVVAQRFVPTNEVPAPVPDELMELRSEVQTMKGQLAILTATVGQLTATMRQQATMIPQATTASAICPTCPPGFASSMTVGNSSFSFPGEIISSRVVSSYEIPCPPAVTFGSGTFATSPYVSPGVSSLGFNGSTGLFAQPAATARPAIIPIICIRGGAARRLANSLLLQNALSGGRGF